MPIKSCDLCGCASSHEGLTETGRWKHCCVHHVTSGGAAYVGHPECLTAGAVRAVMTIDTFTQLVKDREAAENRTFFERG